MNQMPYPYMPFPYPNINEPNVEQFNNKLARLERQIKNLERRVSRLENNNPKQLNSLNNDYVNDDGMYMM